MNASPKKPSPARALHALSQPAGAFRLTAALALAVLLGLAWGLLAPAITQGQQAGLAEPPFGPVLFVIEPGPGSLHGGLPAALPPTVVLHTRLDDAGGVRYLASGGANDPTAVQAAGAGVTLLDNDTAGDPADPSTRPVYYLADATADNAAALAAQAGDVLYAGTNVLVVRTTAAGERAFVEQLATQGVPVSLVTGAALAPESADTLVDAATAGAASAVPDPTVAALLPKLTEGDLRYLIDRLSGQVAVTVGGSTVTLNTRYTFSARIQDAERYVYEYYQALGIPVSYVPWTYGSYSGRTIVAEVKGATTPDKVLLVGGHLDNISEIPYTTAPGADDNGTGTATTLLIAKLLKQYRPDVTVRFVHFTSEEQGHWASKIYAAQLRSRGEQVIGFLDLDMFGYDGNRDRVVEIHTGSGPKSNALGSSFLERNTRYGPGLTFEVKSSTASRFSDHSSFWDQDYASFLIIENFFDDAIVRDRNPYYHNTGDLPVRVDYDYTARIGRVALATMYELGGFRDPGQATPTPAPTTQPTPVATPTPSPTPEPGGCTNLLVNGDFETTGGWLFGSTPAAGRYVTSPVYSGQRAVALGIPAGSANKVAHSSAYQKVTIPATAPSPVVLRFAMRPGGAADGVDYREALLLNTSYGYLATLERSRLAGNDQWVERSFDVTAYRGRTLVVYFNVYNDGKGTQMWNTLDAVLLGGCTSAAAGVDEGGNPLPLPQVELQGDWRLYLPALQKES